MTSRAATCLVTCRRQDRNLRDMAESHHCVPDRRLAVAVARRPVCRICPEPRRSKGHLREPRVGRELGFDVFLAKNEVSADAPAI